jgi:hypothetical protein
MKAFTCIDMVLYSLFAGFSHTNLLLCIAHCPMSTFLLALFYV